MSLPAYKSSLQYLRPVEVPRSTPRNLQQRDLQRLGRRLLGCLGYARDLVSPTRFSDLSFRDRWTMHNNLPLPYSRICSSSETTTIPPLSVSRESILGKRGSEGTGRSTESISIYLDDTVATKQPKILPALKGKYLPPLPDEIWEGSKRDYWC